jgi:hypothetical protein
METDLAHDEQSPSLRQGRNIVRDLLLALLVVAVLPGFVLVAGNWQLALLLLLYLMVTNTDRFRFTLRSERGWLVAGTVFGACIGGILPINCTDYSFQMRESLILTVGGAILGTMIGMVIDFVKYFPQGTIRMRFRFWHIFAYLAICILSTFIVWSLLDLFRL